MATNLSGGKDVTGDVTAQAGGGQCRLAEDQSAARRGTAVGRVRRAKCGLEVWEGYDKSWKCGAPLVKP